MPAPAAAPPQLQDVGMRHRVELLAQQALVHPRVLERARPIARGFERSHQPERDPPVRRLGGGTPAPPAHCGPPVTRRFGRLGHRFQRRRVPLGEARPLPVGPRLEFHALRQVEAVEKRPGVEPHRRLRPILVQEALEIRHIARDARRVETKVVSRRGDDVVAEGGSEQVERVGEGAPGAVGIQLGPEQGEELVAGQRASTGEREHRQQGEPAAARGPTRHRGVGALHRRATEKLERQHVGARERSAERRESGAGCRRTLPPRFRRGNP